MAFNLDRDTSRAECRKDGAGLCRCSLHLLLTCPSVLYLTHELHPVKWRRGWGENAFENGRVHQESSSAKEVISCSRE
ncbi:hypothetical protein NC653_020704 [Populus alba x Populus x berolinensis]|uniref:Uncharacterized protein n=1 Tax=Populus alba x Populus x berolinensis TaxID=444605 RepID=A0AAD6ML29_9ROSI|nr:hypothetical protein NC653_020704 [Populus alba x Populus x berolinensis]